MAMIKCPECGNEISSDAISCPQCGKKIKGTGIEGIIDSGASAFVYILAIVIPVGFLIWLGSNIVSCVGYLA